MTSPGLRSVQQYVLKEKMLRPATKDGSMKCLVADSEGRRILDACCTMSEVTEEGVTHVENLSGARQQQSTLGAIYFIAPTRGSIERLLGDFSNRQRKYPEAWIFFTKRVPDELFELISKDLDKNEGFKHSVPLCRELNMEFVPIATVSNSSFSLGLPELFHQMYHPRDDGESVDYDRVVDRLFQLCITIGEVPEIAYFNLDSRSQIDSPKMKSGKWRTLDEQNRTDREIIALRLREKLRAFNSQAETKSYVAEMNKQFRSSFGLKAKSWDGDSTALLVLLDRSVDPVAPLIHDLCYEAMCNDVLSANPYGELTYHIRDSQNQEVEQTLEISSSDPSRVWQHHWGTHLCGAFSKKPLGDELASLYAKFQEEYRVFYDDAASGTAAREKLGRLPDFMRKKKAYSGHVDVATQLSGAFDRRQLREVCTFVRWCSDQP